MRPRVRRRVLLPMAALAVGITAFSAVAPAGAQEIGSDCDLVDFGSIFSDAPAPGARMTWLGRPVMVCPDGTRLRADSAVVTERNRRVELIGNVRYETPERILESRMADYYELEERLHARGDVVFRERERESVIRGDELVHLAAGPRRPYEQVTVTGGRPSAEIPPRAEAVEGAEPMLPYRVTGNRLRFEGQDHFWADGDVEVFRGDLEAYADSLAFDQEMGQLFLNGNARVLGDAEMEGDRIQMAMPGDVLRSIIIRERGRVRSADLDLVGDEIRIEMADEQIQSVVAVQYAAEEPSGAPGDETSPEGGSSPQVGQRARASTEEFILEGDSIFVSAPAGVLREVHAMGRARGESRGRGPEFAIVPPEQEIPPEEGIDRVHELTEADWIEGDEIFAFFEEAPAGVVEDPDFDVPPPDEEVANPDEAGEQEGRREYRLERLEARGNARSLYRTPPEDEDDPDETDEDRTRRWSISYIMASEILIYMVEGEVDRLEAREEVLGIQLEPERRGAPDGGGAPDPEVEG